MKFLGAVAYVLAILTLITCVVALWGGFTVHFAIILAEAGWDIFS